MIVFELKRAAKLRPAGVRMQSIMPLLHARQLSIWQGLPIFARYGRNPFYGTDDPKLGDSLFPCHEQVMSQSIVLMYRSANTTWLGIAHMETSADMTIRDLTGLKLPKQSSKLNSCCSSAELDQCIELGTLSTSFACSHAAVICCF